MKNKKDDVMNDEFTNFIEKATLELTGYSPDSLLKEMEEAERQWELEQQENPEEAAAVMRKAEEDFLKLMACIHKGEKEEAAKTGGQNGKGGCLEGIGCTKEKTAEMRDEKPVAMAGQSTDRAGDEGYIRAEADGEGYTGSKAEGKGYAGSMDDGTGTAKADGENAVNASDKKQAVEVKAVSDKEDTVNAAGGEGYTKAVVAGKSSMTSTTDETYPGQHRTIAKAEPEYRKPIVIRKKALRRVAFLTAAAMLLGIGGMASVARQGYRVAEYPEQYEKQRRYVVTNNVAVYFFESEIEEAYNQIADTCGIKVLALDYIPERMELEDFVLSGKKGILTLCYNDKKIHLEQKNLDERNTVSVLTMDRKQENIIQNDWLDQELYIEENMVEDGLVEYSTQFITSSAAYYLSGIMEKAEFMKVVENLYFWN